MLEERNKCDINTPVKLKKKTIKKKIMCDDVKKNS